MTEELAQSIDRKLERLLNILDPPKKERKRTKKEELRERLDRELITKHLKKRC